MRDWRGELRQGLRGTRIAPETVHDLVEELALDLEERARAARSAGATDEEAEARAWAGLGGLDQLRARLEALHGEAPARRAERAAPLGALPSRQPFLGLGQDLRLALRSLRRHPGFTATALLTLGLGIGANTALFSVVNALFFTPLPAVEPERVVAVYTSDYSGPRYGNSSFPDFEDLRGRADLFETLAAYTYEAVALRTDREPARVWGEFVTGGYFPALGFPMAQGRPVGPDDDREGAEPVVVISHGLWQRRLAGDPAPLGQALTLSGVRFTIVGVAPAGYTGLTRGVAAEVWLPLSVRARLVPGSGGALRNRGSRFLSLVGRLPRDLDSRDAQARLDVVAAQLRAAHPDQWTDRAGETRRLTLLREAEARVSPAAFGTILGLSAMLGVVAALILLIACANVANLMLARASTRRREFAVRLALGASRGRVVRHFLAESLLVAGLGGLLGLGLAAWAGGALRVLSLPLPVPLHLNVGVDFRVLAFALSLTLVTGLLLGVLPALHAARPDLVPALKDEGSGVASGARGRKLRRLFAGAQVALSMVLLVGAGLLLRGMTNATRVAPGFDAETTHLVPVDLGLAGYDVGRAQALVERLAERLPGIPGLRAAALSVTLPIETHVARRSTFVTGHTPQAGEDREFYFGVVGPGHFEALGIPILRGREFTPADRAAAPLVAIVNETFAKRFWPGDDPVGRTLRTRGPEGPLVTVVGLAKDSKYRRLAEDPMPFYYLPVTQDYGFVERYTRFFPVHLALRGAGDPAALARAVAGVVREIDPKLPVYPPKSMLDHLGTSLLPARVASAFFAAFGVLGLLLASLGLYGVVAYAVAQRTQEIGVRIALGASRPEVLRMVLRDGLGLTARGLAVGALLALGLGQALKTWLYGLSPFDPVTFVLVPIVLALVALLASAIPAGRAAAVDPVVALRYE